MVVVGTPKDPFIRRKGLSVVELYTAYFWLGSRQTYTLGSDTLEEVLGSFSIIIITH